MLTYIGIVLAATVAQAPTSTAAAPCADNPSSCRQVSAAELFAAADRAAEQGDLASAEIMLEALTNDPNIELRTEARFRLASLREKRGNRGGAISALRALLEEKPDAHRARLELSRLLAVQGDDSGARRELRKAAAGGLPPEVAKTVRKFSTALNSLKRRGASIEFAIAPDSNINRSTSDQYVDTVIAPFELSDDARGKSGIGLSLGGQAFSRDALFGGTFLTRAGVRGDFFGKKRFNDIQFSLATGPEITTSLGRFRPAVTHERRWYGGHAYSTGYGVSLNWLTIPTARSQLQVDASAIRQSIRNNDVLDGYRYALSASYDHAFTLDTTGRIALRGAALDAKVKPESVIQGGGDILLAHNFGFATLFGQAGYTKTWGRAPMFLFGKTRDDDRFDLGAGFVAHKLAYAGLAPLVRVIYTHSASNIALYDYRRTRLELGLSREF